MILSGNTIKEELLPKLKEEFGKLSFVSQLVIIQIGQNSASSVYINQKKKMGELLGVKVLDVLLHSEITEEEVLEVIENFNNDEETFGIIVQLPIPESLDKRKILDSIKPEKDIDGLGSLQSGFLVTKNKKAFIPATTKGVLTILDYYKIETKGKNVVVVGRSNLVGLPTAISLINKDATVTVCHSYTQNLEEITKKADILIVACGKPKFINKDFVNSNQTIIDIGIHRLEDGLCGDVNFEEVKGLVSNITPVPGGVGPLTVISLFENLLDASKR